MQIDIIIPMYHSTKTIQQTLGSILMQTVIEDIQVTLVNDGDGQDYNSIIKPFTDLMHIQELKMPRNQGPGAARQFGIDHTSASYIMFVDSDDTLNSPFAVELLLRELEQNQDYVMCGGAFVEEHENLHFTHHINDITWIFRKIYRRAFLEKYQIRFTHTSANEDTGFNSKIKLIATQEEQICFIQNIVYNWHATPNSITRKNDFEYTYNQSFEGYVINIIDTFHFVKKNRPYQISIDDWAIAGMANLYWYYYATLKFKPEFAEQNFKHCIKYYTQVYRHVETKYPNEMYEDIFAKEAEVAGRTYRSVVPDKTIYQFINNLKTK